MRRNRQRRLAFALIGLLAQAGWTASWSAKQEAALEGFDVPESVCIDPATGVGYVSNIATATKGFWEADGVGFITRLNPGGDIDRPRWLASSQVAPLHAAKGLAVLENVLYVADIDVVRRYDLATGKPLPPRSGQGWRQLNDVATDGRSIYVSDTAAGKVYRLTADGFETIPAPASVNGVTVYEGHLYAVSWRLHDLFELDPRGRADPQPFGLAEQFTALDGIEVLDDGTFVVSDFLGHEVCTVAPDRRTVRVLANVRTPADIGIDRARELLFVPQFGQKRVVVYSLQRAEDK